ncbi:uncharacterized protein LOC131688741 [Topomyia yanbarensis]|uniref:uncharacterized protein LOC131688741 n=1 Tax=Topomyia yanbarensis TaxID=2498891 RepID=UPI00273AAE82|nr:uncharacterized protein LOC131688741 [Topomyia yanbarensis]
MFSTRYKSSLPLGRLMVVIYITVSSIGHHSRAVEVPSNCIQHTDSTGTFDQYYELDKIGNQRSEAVPVDFTMYVEVQNFQEEIAILLSSKDRSNEFPDFARTYEIRVGNVYTVIYRETLKMQAYHAPKTVSAENCSKKEGEKRCGCGETPPSCIEPKLFPEDKFKIHFKIRREGNITVTIDDNVRRPLLNVDDEHRALDVRYISFASRYNAYPITFHFGCINAVPSTEGPRAEAMTGCPVCPRQKCEVIVKACTDNNKDAAGEDPEKQKYYFYFNMFLSKNRGKGGPTETNQLD